MMHKAQGLFEKGLYQRAATVLMDAFNRSKNEEQRMKILIERQRCLPKPSSSPAAVEILLFPPDARRRDIDNYNKALFDALTHAGIWEDDSQVQKMLVEWGPKVHGGRVEISITRHQPTMGGIG
ncbi:hypothetical protein CVE39_15810 [Enterobacter cloacae complex sp.]|nr:hypothetical protein CVE39_15810 [Enterobacter cloacae complex sp.]